VAAVLHKSWPCRRQTFVIFSHRPLVVDRCLLHEDVFMNLKSIAPLIISLSLTSVAAQTPATGSLLVLSKGDRTLSVVDPATLKVVGTAPSGPDPHEVVASSDGRTAYIANYNGGNNIITPVDLVSIKALPPIDLGPLRAPHGLSFVAGKVWFTAEAARVIASYDPAARKVDWVLGTGQSRTQMIYVAPEVNWMVTSNMGSATMTFIDRTTGSGRGGAGRGGPAAGGPPPGAGGPPPGGGGRGPGAQTDWEETVVPVGRGAEGFDVSPDGKEVWAANAQDGTISVIDVATRRVTQTLAANVNGANRLKFTPDGKMVFVSTLSGPDVIVLDAAARKEIKRIPVGHGAAGIQMQPDGTRVYAACTPDDYVVVIDIKTLAVTGRIDAGKQPDGLAWVVRR
jgi:YVTN family beta-propeller protein